MDRIIFLDQGIERHATCDLCKETPSEVSRINSHNCRGIYCLDCLNAHFAHHNTCPIHPDVVLFLPERNPVFVCGERKPVMTLDEITDKAVATKFITHLWHATKPLYDFDRIFESDIVEIINQALKVIAEPFNNTILSLVKEAHEGAIIDTTRLMVEMRFASQNKAVLDGLNTDLWMELMAGVMGWKLRT